LNGIEGREYIREDPAHLALNQVRYGGRLSVIEALRNVSQEYIEEGVPVLVPTTYENEDGETVHADAEVMVEPGTTGFVRAFVDELPSPFDCDSEALADLPVYDVE